MVFEPNFTKVASSVRKNIGITQSVIELKLPTNEDVIDAIYSVGARSTIISSEAAGNEVSFVGMVDFQAVFASLGVSAIDYTAEFKDRYVAQEELRGELILNSNVVDVSSNIVSGGIRVVAIVETMIDMIFSQDINVLTGVSGDGVHLSKTNIQIESYIGKASEKFDVSHDFQIADAIKVLMVTPNICVRNVELKDNYLIVSGVVNVDVCYQSGNDLSDIKNAIETLDFAYEVALNGIDIDSNIQSLISIVFNEIKVSTMLEDKGANINLYLPIQYVGYVMNKRQIEIVDDVYSEKNYLSVTSENFGTMCCEKSIKFKDMISGVASISESAPFIDEILGVCANNIVLASSNVIDDKLIIEGVANASVVYFTKETSSITSVQVEMPFVVEEKVEGQMSSIVSLCLSKINARSKRGKEIEVSGELNVYSDMYGMKTECIISSVVVGEEKPCDDCVLYIYIVKDGETIWDVAKNMNVSKELLFEQNPDIQASLNAGDKLVVYKPRMFDF